MLLNRITIVTAASVALATGLGATLQSAKQPAGAPPAQTKPAAPPAAKPAAPAAPAAGAASANTLSADEKSAGWVLLFDGTNIGKNFRGYKKQELPAAWVVEDGCIVLRGSAGDLITREQYDNFEFQTDWNVAEGGNSGIIWHATEDGTYPWETGIEMQILDDAKHPDGKNRLTSAGSCYALYAPPEGVVKPAGQWNTARVMAVGPKITYFLNGTKVLEFDMSSDDYKTRVAKSKFATMPMFGTKSKGHIALQDHGDVVKFRNVKVRPLGADGKPVAAAPVSPSTGSR